MNQKRVDKLAVETYGPEYKAHGEDAAVRGAVAKIVAEERAKQYERPVWFSQAVRTRVSELLQARIPVVDPPMDLTGGAGTVRAALDAHHDHQTAHFQAIWQLVDILVRDAGVELEKAVSK